MRARRSILALIFVLALVAAPPLNTWAGCPDHAPACATLCSTGVALLEGGAPAVGLEPAGGTPDVAAFEPSILVLAVPQPPPELASPFVQPR